MSAFPITKSQLAWLFLRGFGLYLGYIALQGFVSMIYLATVMEQMNAALAGPLLFAMAGSVYFLFFGEGAYQLLMREKSGPVSPSSVSDSQIPRTPPAPAEREDPITTLTPSEKASFALWLEEHPELKKVHLDDQIARFRDYQRNQQRP